MTYVSMPSIEYAGTHIILDTWGVSPELLRDDKRIEEILIESAQMAGATVLHSHMHHFGGEYGVTGVIALSESHISIHTWPEHGYAAIDVFMCGDCDPNISGKYIVDKFAAKEYTLSELIRGVMRNSRLNV